MTRSQQTKLISLFVPVVIAIGWGIYRSFAPVTQVLGTPSPVPSPITPATQVIATPSGQVAGTNHELAQVKKVIDGDTIELSDGRKVRYIGMDTPETHDPRKAVGCYGVEAAAENQKLVEGKTVELEKDVSETDRYGRLLRYVYVDGQFINQILVSEGYARNLTYPPDVKYQAVFKQAETEARAAGKGLWGSTTCDGNSFQKVPTAKR